MHPNSLANLQKWTKGTSGNPAGRKLGSKHIASIVREFLEQDIDTRFPLNDRLKQLIAGNGTSYAKAIVYAMLLKANPQHIKLTKEEFLNTLKTAAGKMKAGSAAQKDVLCRILFLNLRVDNEKVASYLWREPFASMVKAIEISSGRVGAINLEQLDVLLNSLKTYWDYSNQKSFLAEIKSSQTSVNEAEKVLAYEL